MPISLLLKDKGVLRRGKRPTPSPKKCSCLLTRLQLFQAQNQGHPIRKDRESVNGHQPLPKEGVPSSPEVPVSQGRDQPPVFWNPEVVYKLAPTPCCPSGSLQRQRGHTPLNQGSPQEKGRGEGPCISSCFLPRMTQRAERPRCAVNRGSSGWGLVCGDWGWGCWGGGREWAGGFCTDARPAKPPLYGS